MRAAKARDYALLAPSARRVDNVRAVKLSRALLLACALAAPHAGADEARESLIADVAKAASGFLAALPEDRRLGAKAAFQSRDRTTWRYTPGGRPGMPLQEMSPAQREAAQAVLRSFLSADGYLKVQSVIALEIVLRETERWDERDPERYWFLVFGEPGGESPWGVRVEGHHVSLHLAVIKGRFVSSTPTFLGANPAEVRSGPKKGSRALAAEEDTARSLLDSLTAAQRAEAIVDEAPYGDMVSRNRTKADPLDGRGVAYAKLAPPQQKQFLAVIEVYANTMKPKLAEERLAKIRATGLDGVRFAWAGPVARGRPHYYRVQGPTFLIEFDNSGGNHIHSVWRDFEGDFGRDLLREHYGTSAHVDGRHVAK
jgi:hypothetical protein